MLTPIVIINAGHSNAAAPARHDFDLGPAMKNSKDL
jgi:hypothetical protein